MKILRSGGEKKEGWDRIKGGGRQVKDGGPLSYDTLAKTLILFLSHPYIWPTLLQVHVILIYNIHTYTH